MEPSRSTISKSDSLDLAKPQGEGCEDQSTSEDISASAGVPASIIKDNEKKCPTSEMKPCALPLTVHSILLVLTAFNVSNAKDQYSFGICLTAATNDLR